MTCQDLKASQRHGWDWGLNPLTIPSSGFFLEWICFVLFCCCFVSTAGQMALLVRIKSDHGLVVQVLWLGWRGIDWLPKLWMEKCLIFKYTHFLNQTFKSPGFWAWILGLSKQPYSKGNVLSTEVSYSGRSLWRNTTLRLLWGPVQTPIWQHPAGEGQGGSKRNGSRQQLQLRGVGLVRNERQVSVSWKMEGFWATGGYRPDLESFPWK